jgi:hypothetical protein
LLFRLLNAPAELLGVRLVEEVAGCREYPPLFFADVLLHHNLKLGDPLRPLIFIGRKFGDLLKNCVDSACSSKASPTRYLVADNLSISG